MRVLHIGKSDIRGGAQQFAFDLVAQDEDARLLVSRKYTDSARVRTFPTLPLESFLNWVDNIPSYLGITRTLRMMLFAQDEFNFTVRKLKKVPEFWDSDLVQIHNIHGGYFDLRSLRWIARYKPIVWTMHDMWAFTGGEIHTYGHEGFKTSDPRTPYDDRYPLNKPLIDRRQHFFKLRKRIYEDLASRLYFVPVCNWLADNLRASHVVNKHSRIRVIHNGIDVKIFSNEGRRTWEKTRVLVVNNGIPLKGISVFEKAMHMTQADFELWCVGRPLAGLPSDKNVKYLPFTDSRKEFADLLNNVDVLIFPSLADTFPLTVLEAMACGVCVVASAVGGIPEMINHNENGFLFRPGVHSDLAEILNNLPDHVNRIRSMGLAAADRVNAEFSFEKMMEKYACLYREIEGVSNV